MFSRKTFASILVFAHLLGYAWSQQLSGAQAHVGYPGLSDDCRAALSTNVSCPIILNQVSTSEMVLDHDQATAICTEECYSTLQTARSTILKACSGSTEIIVYDTIAYPATFIADRFLHAYNISCVKDSDGQFCDPQILSWSKQRFLSTNQSCSECWLRSQAIQLNSTFGYDDTLATNFESLASSCNVSSYTFTSPTPYALNATATSTEQPTQKPTPSPSCSDTYTVKQFDDCNTVAKALNVSTYNLLHENDLDLYCQSFSSRVGSKLCVPCQCSTYTWQAYDTCQSVLEKFNGTTLSQFLSWNPNFNPICGNSFNFIGYEVCVSAPLDSGANSSSTAVKPSSETLATSTIAPSSTLISRHQHRRQWP